MKLLLVIRLIFCFTFLFLQGCYLTTQGWHLLVEQTQAVPIERLLDDNEITTAERNFFTEIEAIHASARDILGLENDKNYRKYIKTDRKFSVLVVSATRKDSFERYYWSYPIYGKLPYRGYYREQDAQMELQRLEQKQFDVLLRPVSSFSSQDYFSAPLYSFMLNQKPGSLAELIFHELSHSRLWLKNHTQFNEEFATFVGLVGARYYLEQKYGRESTEYLETVNAQTDFATLRRFMSKLRQTLANMYDHDLEYEQTMIEKQRIIRQFRKNFIEHYDENFISASYQSLTEYPINNAYLNLFDTYAGTIHIFYNVYEHFGQDLAETIRYIVAIEHEMDKKDEQGRKIDIDPYDYLKSILRP